MSWGRAAISGAIAVAALSGCTATDSTIEESAHDERPTLVSLNPCLDAILVEIAGPEQVLAISHYSHEPSSSSILPDMAAQFASTGGTMEEILALNPSHVLASTFLAPSTEQAMRDLELEFSTFASPRTMEESIAQIEQLGELTERQNRARVLAMQVRFAVDRHGASEEHRPIYTVLWQPGEIVPGEAALISELMRTAGFASHSAKLGLGQADYLPLETLLANPPELLLVAGDSRGQMHPALAQLDNTRVEHLDPALLYCGGPTIIRAMERLAEIRESMLQGAGG